MSGLILQRHLQNIVFYHKGLEVRKTPLPLVAGTRKAAVLRGKIWSAHASDVVGLEGSCQEAIPLPSTTFDMFFVVFRSAHATPDWPSQTHPCFHSRGVGSDAPHQSPIRFKASGRLAPRPDVCPWHCACPRKPSVPCRVQSCTTYRYMAPSRGPPLTGLTAEASHDWTMWWHAICHRLRLGLIR